MTDDKVTDMPPSEGDSLIQLTVTRAEDGIRLDKWLSSEIPSLSRSRIKALAQEGYITLDDTKTRALSKAVREGQRVGVTVPKPKSATPHPEDIALSVAYEDSHLIVIDKPQGMVVHPAPGAESGTLVNALLHHCGESLSGIGGVARPGIVHRIDKDTTGLLVVAKTDEAHHGLAAQFEAHSVHRRYRALAYNAPNPHKNRLKTQIGRHPVDRKRMAVLDEGKGKTAITHYQTEQRFHLGGQIFASEITCELETGRTHQVRVHMAHVGCPLIGDPVYARRKKVDSSRYPALAQVLAGFTRQALHAETLGFQHPILDTPLKFSSPLPHDMAELLKTLAESQAAQQL